MTPLASVDQVLQANLDRLAAMAKVAAFTNRESVTYGLVTEALILQRSPANDYVIFPQLYIDWKPQRNDRRHVLPDFGIGRYVWSDLCFHLQGGAEVKALHGLSMEDVVESVPEFNIDNLTENYGLIDFRESVTTLVSAAYIQAEDQIKSAIKCGHLPYHGTRVYTWLLFVGPYFRTYDFGPFTEAQVTTRGHKPNPSGDYRVLKFIANREVPLGNWFTLGTEAGHNHLRQYILATGTANAGLVNRPDDASSDFPQP